VEEFITISRKEYEELKRENAELHSKIAELRLLVVQFETTVSLLKGGKNSRTSSTAPSHDIGRSNRVSLRVASGKKSGGQCGHPGHTLDMVDTPDEIIEHFPAVCQCCGNGLDNTAIVSFTRRQVVDIPPILPVYTEHRSHLKICPFCKTENRGIFPDSVTAPVQYGSRIEAMTGYLSVYQSLPYARITHLFKDFLGLNISEGTVDRLLDNLSRKATFAYETIKSRIESAVVVGSDETSCRVNGKKYWFHVWQTSNLTFIVAFASRGFEVIRKLFNGDFSHSYYVSDCWSSQLKVKAKMHQLCFAHLLRDLNNFVENLGSPWSAKMKALFKNALELKNKMTADDYLNPPPQVDKLKGELDELLKTDYSKFHTREQAFVKRMIKNRHSIFTFLKHPLVPPDNNASERAIRNVKVKMKVSGQFRNSDGKGADRYAKIRSVIDTTIKNGQDVYAALVCMANCKIIEVPE
jgi:transposase